MANYPICKYVQEMHRCPNRVHLKASREFSKINVIS